MATDDRSGGRRRASTLHLTTATARIAGIDQSLIEVEIKVARRTIRHLFSVIDALELSHQLIEAALEPGARPAGLGREAGHEPGWASSSPRQAAAPTPASCYLIAT